MVKPGKMKILSFLIIGLFMGVNFTAGIFNSIVEAVTPDSILNEIDELNNIVSKEIITEDNTPPITWVEFKGDYYDSYITEIAQNSFFFREIENIDYITTLYENSDFKLYEVNFDL